MAPITIGGHQVYGVYIVPGIGYRNNQATGIAIEDEPEGIYIVFDGTHYDSGCCFDYGNASTNGRADGTGTMETIYFGNTTAWGYGDGNGPWIMADLESGLFSGVNAEKQRPPHRHRFRHRRRQGRRRTDWAIRGGNAQSGGLSTFFNGCDPLAEHLRYTRCTRTAPSSSVSVATTATAPPAPSTKA